MVDLQSARVSAGNRLRAARQREGGELPPPFVPTFQNVTFAEVRSFFPDDEPVFDDELRKEQLAARQAACLNNPRGF